jgi:hypothetical protein
MISLGPRQKSRQTQKVGSVIQSEAKNLDNPSVEIALKSFSRNSPLSSAAALDPHHPPENPRVHHSGSTWMKQKTSIPKAP